MQIKGIPFDVKSLADDGSEFTGHGAVFGNLDRVGDVILPGAFKATLPRFLREGVIAWQHDWSTPIGRPIDAREDETGLYVHASISDTSMGRDARTLMRDGVVKRLSIGYDAVEYEPFTRESLKRCVGEAAFDQLSQEAVSRAVHRGRALKRVELYEISPVSVAANPLAEITRVKAALEENEDTLALAVALDGWVARTRALLADERSVIRADGRGGERKEGRVLSAVNRRRLEALCSTLLTCCQDVEELLRDAEARTQQDAHTAEVGTIGASDAGIGKQLGTLRTQLMRHQAEVRRRLVSAAS